MEYFKFCKTNSDAKPIYRKYALIFHPDRGGNTEQFQDLNKQYKDFAEKQFSENSTKTRNGIKPTFDVGLFIKELLADHEFLKIAKESGLYDQYLEAMTKFKIKYPSAFQIGQELFTDIMKKIKL